MYLSIDYIHSGLCAVVDILSGCFLIQQDMLSDRKKAFQSKI